MAVLLTDRRRAIRQCVGPPAKRRIEVVRYIRSDRQLSLFGKRIDLDETDVHQYVTAIIKVRAGKLIVVDTNGEIIHHSDFNLSRELR